MAQEARLKAAEGLDSLPMSRVAGPFCVVAATDGSIAVHKITDAAGVYAHATRCIGCTIAEPVRAMKVNNSVDMVFLVNECGYLDWPDDVTKINPIGTCLYNSDEDLKDSPHYILGDIVFCLEVYGNEGADYVGMSEQMARSVSGFLFAKVKGKAETLVHIPAKLPRPKYQVMEYDSADKLYRALHGDKSVEPTSVKRV